MMSNSFTAIDFETAQGKRYSICQVGLVRIENGIITDKINKLVQPPENYYFYRNTEIHGISAVHTCNAPTFDRIWHEIKPFIQDQLVVAHNAAFDISCLKQALLYYGLEKPAFRQQCTYKIYGKDLASLCRQYRISLQHHDALSDAIACAELFKMHLGMK